MRHDSPGPSGAGGWHWPTTAIGLLGRGRAKLSGAILLAVLRWLGRTLGLRKHQHDGPGDLDHRTAGAYTVTVTGADATTGTITLDRRPFALTIQ